MLSSAISYLNRITIHFDAMSRAFYSVTDANTLDGVGKDLSLKDDGRDIELIELGEQPEGSNNK